MDGDDDHPGAAVEAAAVAGDVDAQLKMGWYCRRSCMLLDATPEEHDAKAVRWWQMAAAQGAPDAQYMLARFLEDGGGGLAKDEPEAIRLYTLCAQQQHEPYTQSRSYAMLRLGECYADGLCGVARDDREAVRWFRLSAGACNAGAQWVLSQFCETGRGMPEKNDADAAAWCMRAAEQYERDAMFRLGEYHETGFGGILKCDAEALYWFHQAIGLGHGDARRKWAAHREALMRGEARAQYAHGMLCRMPGLFDDGLVQPPGARKTESRVYLEMAAEQGHVGAQEALRTLDRDE